MKWEIVSYRVFPFSFILFIANIGIISFHLFVQILQIQASIITETNGSTQMKIYIFGALYTLKIQYTQTQCKEGTKYQSANERASQWAQILAYQNPPYLAISVVTILFL